MIISPFTPLFFCGTISDGIESRYMQTFAKTDVILIECICGAQEDASQVSLVCGGSTRNISTTAYVINDSVTLRYAELTGLDNGVYQVRIGDKTSREFRVTDNEAELAATTLIQYSMRNNCLTTEGVFVVDGVRKFFSLRVPGGFKDSDIAYGCDSEQFSMQNGDVCTLYSVDTVQVKFTMGSQIGVPACFGELLNRLLTCTYVYFNGVRHERKDSSTPEVNVQMEGLDSFVYKILLQRVSSLCPTLADGIADSVDDESSYDGEWGGGSGSLGGNTGEGTGGVDMAAVWAALANPTNEKINSSHLPLLKRNDNQPATDSNVFSAARTLAEIDKNSSHYLRRDKDDHTTHKLGAKEMQAGSIHTGQTPDPDDPESTWNGGSDGNILLGGTEGKIASDDFSPGMLNSGNGWQITKAGRGEMKSLVLRESLTVPELRFNRQTLILGTEVQSMGGGIIESVIIDTPTTGRVMCQLEEGEAAAVEVGDLCYGIWHNLTGGNSEDDYDGHNGNIRVKGFQTIYFHITDLLDQGGNIITPSSTNVRVSGFKYRLRGCNEGENDYASAMFHPQAHMHFAQYANLTNEDRQHCVIRTPRYTIGLTNMASWTYDKNNIYYIQGDLSGFQKFDDSNEYFRGYGLVFGNAYFYGSLQKIENTAVIASYTSQLGGSMLENQQDTVVVRLTDVLGVEQAADEFTWQVVRSSDNAQEDSDWNDDFGTADHFGNPYNGTFTFYFRRRPNSDTFYDDLLSSNETGVMFTIIATHQTTNKSAKVQYFMRESRKGDDGDSYISHTVCLYKRHAAQPTSSNELPGSVVYYFEKQSGYFDDSGHILMTSSTLNGWTFNIPDGSEQCWVVQATALAEIPDGGIASAYDTITASEWSTPRKYVKDGEDNVVADLTNEMDSVPLTKDGGTISATLKTKFAIYDGAEKAHLVSLTKQSTSSYVTASFSTTPSSSNNPTEVEVTISVEAKANDNTNVLTNDKATVTLTGTTKSGKERTAVFTVQGVRAGQNGDAAVIYRLQPAYNAIKRDKDGEYITPPMLNSTSKLIVEVLKVSGSENQSITPGSTSGVYLYYSRDDSTTWYSYPSGGITVKSDSISTNKNIRLRLQSVASGSNTPSGIIYDRETIPVVEDGIDATNIVADADNENINVIVDANDKIIATRSTVVGVHIYKNGVDQGLTSILDQGNTGYLYSQSTSAKTATIRVVQGNTLATTTDVKLKITATTGDERTITIKLNPIKPGADGKPATVYELEMSHSAIHKNKAGAYTPSNGNLIVKVVKVEGETRSYVPIQMTTSETARVLTTHSSEVFVTLPDIKYDANNGETFNDAAQSSLPSTSNRGLLKQRGTSTTEGYIPAGYYNTGRLTNMRVEVWKSGVMLDAESIPILQDGQDGKSIVAVDEYYKVHYTGTGLGPSFDLDYIAELNNGWSRNTIPATSKGDYLWNVEVCRDSDGNIVGSVSDIKAHCVCYIAKDGQKIVSVTNYYRLTDASTDLNGETVTVSRTGTTLTTPSGWSLTPLVTTQAQPRLWNFEVTVYNDNDTYSHECTKVFLLGNKGEQGEQGPTGEDGALPNYLEGTTDGSMASYGLADSHTVYAEDDIMSKGFAECQQIGVWKINKGICGKPYTISGKLTITKRQSSASNAASLNKRYVRVMVGCVAKVGSAYRKTTFFSQAISLGTANVSSVVYGRCSSASATPSSWVSDPSTLSFTTTYCVLRAKITLSTGTTSIVTIFNLKDTTTTQEGYAVGYPASSTTGTWTNVTPDTTSNTYALEIYFFKYFCKAHSYTPTTQNWRWHDMPHIGLRYYGGTDGLTLSLIVLKYVCNTNTTNAAAWCGASMLLDISGGATAITGEFSRYSGNSVVWPSVVKDRNINVRACCIPDMQWEFRELKIEEGDHSTPWCPAAADSQQALNGNLLTGTRTGYDVLDRSIWFPMWPTRGTLTLAEHDCAITPNTDQTQHYICYGYDGIEQQGFIVKPNEFMVFSVDMRFDNPEQNSKAAVQMGTLAYGRFVVDELLYRNDFYPTSEWQRFYLIVPAMGSYERKLHLRIINDAPGKTLHFRKPKLEYGRRPTPWCINDQDTDNSMLIKNMSLSNVRGDYDPDALYCYNTTSRDVVKYTDGNYYRVHANVRNGKAPATTGYDSTNHTIKGIPPTNSTYWQPASNLGFVATDLLLSKEIIASRIAAVQGAFDYLKAQYCEFNDVTVRGVLNNLITVIDGVSSDKLISNGNGYDIDLLRCGSVIKIKNIHGTKLWLPFIIYYWNGEEYHSPSWTSHLDATSEHRSQTKFGGTKHLMTTEEMMMMIGREFTIIVDSNITGSNLLYTGPVIKTLKSNYDSLNDVVNDNVVFTERSWVAPYIGAGTVIKVKLQYAVFFGDNDWYNALVWKYSYINSASFSTNSGFWG